ncbi:hypothetical protein RRF57_011616 [Xylaria bambusicola]|uniref:Uncharacterized protein n=1 Tax=Xylaria bambusicola TaxID=326684 RepID=A0AAN7UN55_9PEZI
MYEIRRYNIACYRVERERQRERREKLTLQDAGCVDNLHHGEILTETLIEPGAHLDGRQRVEAEIHRATVHVNGHVVRELHERAQFLL